MNLSRMLIRNALVGGGARLFTLLVGLVITPYLLARLGMDRFGIWALLGVVTGLVALGDFSFKTSLIRHLAGAWAKGDRQSVRAFASSGLFFCLANALLLGALLWWNTDRLLDLLNIPLIHRSEARLTFAFGVAAQLTTIGLAIFPALCDARQRLDITNGLGMVSLVLGAALTVAAVESGFGLPGVALAQLAATLIFFLTSLLATRRLFGPLGLSPRAVRARTLRTLLGFGMTLHLSTVCGIINQQFDKFLLIRWTGLGWVGSYELALKWVGNAGSLQPFLAAALLPAGSHLAATGDMDGLRAIYRKAYRYLFLVGLPPFFFLAVHAEAIMRVWLGHADHRAASLLVLLSAGYAANSLSNGMAYVCQGVGRPDIQAAQSFVQLLLNVGLSAVLFLLIGPLGAAVGTSLSLLAGAALFVVFFHRHLAISSGSLLRETALTPFLASLAAAAISRFALAWLEQSDRWLALAGLAGSGLLFLAVYLGICLAGGQVTLSDLARLRALWPRMEGRTR
ncbi:MAG TPA: hypothetical protein DDY20_10410 [Desulfobulbaceae bacterium]|nr:hypothetical protein [Desulfobulbaceae bacterium]